MTRRAGLDAEELKAQARNDLLTLLEGVSLSLKTESRSSFIICLPNSSISGSREEERCIREIFSWTNRIICEILYSTRLWRG